MESNTNEVDDYSITIRFDFESIKELSDFLLNCKAININDYVESGKADIINVSDSESDDSESIVIDKINPEHYKTRAMECIDEMIALYGAMCTLNYCICCVHKYRYRAGNKIGEEAKTDLEKSDWYAKMAQTIREDYDIQL